MTTTIAPESADVASLKTDSLYEIVDGERVEAPPMSFLANLVSNRLSQKIAAFAEGKRLGFSVVECLFRMDPPGHRQRRPDNAFVSTKRWPEDRPIPDVGNALDVVPDLMVEVVSPTDSAEELYDKVCEYFQAGAAQVWIVYPKHATIQAFDHPTASRWLRRDDAVENLPFLPGSRLPSAEIFPAPR